LEKTTLDQIGGYYKLMTLLSNELKLRACMLCGVSIGELSLRFGQVNKLRPQIRGKYMTFRPGNHRSLEAGFEDG
jgi:hypothetical protein